VKLRKEGKMEGKMEETGIWLYEAKPPGRPLYYVVGSDIYDPAGEHRFTIITTVRDSGVVYPIGSMEPAFEVCGNWFYTPGLGGVGVMYSALGDPRPWEHREDRGENGKLRE
jgi:hypothetical protein